MNLLPILMTIKIKNHYSHSCDFVFFIRLVAFRRLLDKAQELPELSAWLAQAAPEQCVPTLWDSNPASPQANHTQAMYRLLLIQVYYLFFYKIPTRLLGEKNYVFGQFLRDFNVRFSYFGQLYLIMTNIGFI